MIDLKEFESKIKYGISFDVVKKHIGDFKKGYIYYLASLIDNILLNEFLSGINSYYEGDLFDQFINGSVTKTSDMEVAINSLFSGMLVAIFDSSYYLIEIRSYPNRSIEEPMTEKSVRGSRDGFVESIITNVGLIRRRIKSSSFNIELLNAGKESKTDIALCYMDNRCRHEVVNLLKDSINKLEIDNLVMSDRALEENIFQQHKSFYPLVRYSERPDIVANHILKGNVAIIIDTSASVILTPTVLLEHTKHVEEYRYPPLVGTMLRMVRYFSILASILIVPLWYLITTFTDYESIFLATPEVVLNIPIFWQIILVELMIEILRIATIHTPTQLSNAMGLVSAILLGQMAIDLGLFVPEILLYCSISAIGGFATPSYELSLANKVTKIILLILISLLGKIGFIIGFFGTIYYLLTITVFGVPYLYPLIPFDLKKLTSFVFRVPQKSEKNGR